MEKGPHLLHCIQHKEDREVHEGPYQKSSGGAQILLPLEYELQDCFPELLNYEHRSFLHHLRVIEEHLPQGAFIHGPKDGSSLWRR